MLESSQQTRGAVRTIIHEEYDPPTKNHNIALIELDPPLRATQCHWSRAAQTELDTPLDFNKYVHPVCLTTLQ